MAVIGQWTTPTTTFHVPDALFTQATNIIVTFKQREYKLTKTDATVIDDTHVSVFLTQLETSKFQAGEVIAQINWKDSGKRAMTKKVKITVEDNLEDEEL